MRSPALGQPDTYGGYTRRKGNIAIHFCFLDPHSCCRAILPLQYRRLLFLRSGIVSVPVSDIRLPVQSLPGFTAVLKQEASLFHCVTRPGHGCNSSHHLKRRGNSFYGMLKYTFIKNLLRIISKNIKHLCLDQRRFVNSKVVLSKIFDIIITISSVIWAPGSCHVV